MMMTEPQITKHFNISFLPNSTSQKEFINDVQNTMVFNAVGPDEALELISARGKNVFSSITSGLTEVTTPKEKVYKIKRSLKGARVKVNGFDNQSFSFGPVWCDNVKRGTALVFKHQEKVRAHAVSEGMPLAKAKVKEFAEVLTFLQKKFS